MKISTYLLASGLGLCLLQQASAQYIPSQSFSNDIIKYRADFVRGANGSPAKNYWQNKADYVVKASFDTTARLLKGNVEITYTNNSPDALNQLWLQLDQNTTKKNSISKLFSHPTSEQDSINGYHIHQLRLFKNGKWSSVSYSVEDTRLLIPILNKAIASGEVVKLAIEYDYVLQEEGGGGRSGIATTRNGSVFEVSYWYPRMCVYDDYYGWNALPFVGGGELYLDYGDIDYTVSVPANGIFVGTGDLLNANEVYSGQTLKRLAAAKASDKTVFIRDAKEFKTGVTKATSGMVSYHYNMQNTRDVAWAYSNAFIWDAAKMNLPGETGLAQSVYPIESIEGDAAWARSTDFLKFSVEHFSEKWFKFPYHIATSVGGSVGGMEFPAMAFNEYKVPLYPMFLLSAHEIGHTWFPMIVGSDERRYPFMDEGFNTFIDIYAHDEYNHGEFAPKRDGEYAPKKGNPADEITEVIASVQNGPTLMTPPDQQDYKTVHPLAYFKSAFGLVLLRDVILGKNRFDNAFRTYIKDWAYKHPKPEDFFRSMENGGGEDLGWFWKGWYYNNWQFDQAIKSVEYNSSTKEATITVENKQQMVFPILVKLTEKNGKTSEMKVPVEVWARGTEAVFHVVAPSGVASVELDAAKQLPDINRANNTWHL